MYNTHPCLPYLKKKHDVKGKNTSSFYSLPLHHVRQSKDVEVSSNFPKLHPPADQLLTKTHQVDLRG